MKKFNKDAMLNMVQQTTVKLIDGREVKLRAFLVKEYKLLMMANEANSNYEKVLIQVLQSCVLDDTDVETLPIFEIENLYLNLWKLSKGISTIPVMFKCTNNVKNEDGTETSCDTEIKVVVNLNTVTLSNEVENRIVLNDSLTIQMRYPNILEAEYFDIKQESDVFDMVNRCIDVIEFNGDVMKVGTDIDFEEVSEIMEYVDDKGFEKLSDFVGEIPQVTISIPVKCPKCGHQEPVVLKGLTDFFA
ncbi:MAG: hypothetical protein ACRC3J_05445 [Culicoidibacterales bacterium]